MQVFWFLPTHGDSRYLGTAEGARQVDQAYLQQVAVAADTLGYEGVLIPTGRSCEDPWIVAASLIPATRRLRFLVAVRPGLVAPTLAARMAATFDRLSQGRLLVNLVTGATRASWPATGCSWTTRSATRPRTNSSASGARRWPPATRARRWTTPAGT